jgi:hypothetical protein
MTPNFKSFILASTAFLLSATASLTFACTCIGKDKQTTESELSFVDMAVKGKVISAFDYTYYDTAAYSLSGTKFDSSQSGYLIRKLKLYKFIINKKYKASANIADTISIITGQGGGDCGYEFEIGKEYIIHSEAWKEKKVAIKKRIIEVICEDIFYTDICRMTQEANVKELDNLNRLTD